MYNVLTTHIPSWDVPTFPADAIPDFSDSRAEPQTTYCALENMLCNRKNTVLLGPVVPTSTCTQYFQQHIALLIACTFDNILYVR